MISCLPKDVRHISYKTVSCAIVYRHSLREFLNFKVLDHFTSCFITFMAKQHFKEGCKNDQIKDHRRIKK